MERIAQTNLQLYNQLRHQGLGVGELTIIHGAYEFLKTLYSGYYQADGKPFVSHGVGVGSILGCLNMPTEFIAAGLLHNIYGNADFGDGLVNLVTERRRRIVRDAVGNRIEGLLVRFRQLRVTPKTVGEISSRLDQLDSTDRNLVIMELADYLEKYIDLGVLYFGDNRWLVSIVDKYGADLIEIARRLDEPKLATALSEAFAQAAAARHEIPDALRTSNDQKYIELVLPRSCCYRLGVYVRKLFRDSLQWPC